ncbi:hypothetical protein BZA77DRAFT_352156 [Pyronema omphalodes]|nr:hypothetical protein BZA77DRAFT_352156 [Pyronema omphalodes]
MAALKMEVECLRQKDIDMHKKGGQFNQGSEPDPVIAEKQILPRFWRKADKAQ